MVSLEPVVMTGLINIAQEISAAGAALQKSSGGNDLNATARSLECMESLQGSCRGLQFKVSDASGCSSGQDFFFGLTGTEMQGCPHDPQQEAKLRESCDCGSITFAAWIYSGNFYIFDTGSKKGEFGAVKAGDVVEIRLTDEDAAKMQYLKNKELLYTSTRETPSQLCAKVCAYTQTPLVEELQWMFKPAQCAKGEVSLMGFSGIFQHRRSKALSKTERLPGSTFNATVHSKNAIEDTTSERVGTSFVIAESEAGTDQNFAIGLASDPDQGSSLESLDHAIHIKGSSLKVYENGVLKGKIHHHVEAGDRIDMILALDEESAQPKIQLHVNGQLLGEIYSDMQFPLYVKVCAVSPGKLIEDLRWIDRSGLQAPYLRHVTSPALGLIDDAAARVPQLEKTVSQLLAEVGALKGAAEEHAQLHKASRVEKESLEAKIEEMQSAAKEQAKLHEASRSETASLEAKLDAMMAVTLPQLHEELGALKTEVASLKETTAKEQQKLHEKSQVQRALLEVQLQEMKAELAADKEAFAKAKADWQAERGALRAALGEKPQVCATNQEPLGFEPSQQGEAPCLRPMVLSKNEANESLNAPAEMRQRHAMCEENEKVQWHHPSSAAQRTSIAKGQGSEEELLAVFKQLSAQNAALLAVIEEKYRVPSEMRLPQQRQPREDTDALRTLMEDKAFTGQKEDLQREQAENEELHCFFRQLEQACQRFNTRAASRSSEAGSDPWELLGSDGPASSAAADGDES